MSTVKLAVFALALSLVLYPLMAGAAGGEACYVVSNWAVPQYVNITLNGSFFMMRLNFLGPNNAGITINETHSYSLNLSNTVMVRTNANYTFTSTLLNVSWLPVEHTAKINLCSTLNPNVITTSTTIPASTTMTTSTTISTSSASTFTSVISTSTVNQQPKTTVTSNSATLSSISSKVSLSPTEEDWLTIGVLSVVVAILIAYTLTRGKK